MNQQHKRPTGEIIKRTLSELEMARKLAPVIFKTETLRELKNLAKGRGDSKIIELFYPGWAKEDFTFLLERLGEPK